MINTLVLDVDGVLKDWIGGFSWWMRKQGYTMHGPASQGECYNLGKMFPCLKKDQELSLIERYNASTGFERLDDILGALDGVQELATRFPQLEHVAVTAAGTHPHTIANRAAHIYDFGIEKAHILPLRASKEPVFRLYPYAIVIEDNLTYLHQARDAGCIPIALSYAHNAGWNGFKADSWSDIPDLVGRILGVEKTHDEEFAA